MNHLEWAELELDRPFILDVHHENKSSRTNRIYYDSMILSTVYSHEWHYSELTFSCKAYFVSPRSSWQGHSSRQAGRHGSVAIAKSSHLSDPQAGSRKRKSKTQSPPFSNTLLPRPHLLILSKQILWASKMQAYELMKNISCKPSQKGNAVHFWHLLFCGFSPGDRVLVVYLELIWLLIGWKVLTVAWLYSPEQCLGTRMCCFLSCNLKFSETM